MVQAAACGLIDLKEARSNDRRWYKRLRLLIDEIERKNYFEFLKIRHSAYCAMLARSEDNELAKEVLKSLEAIQDEIRDSLFPYFANKQETKDNKNISVNQSRNERLKSAWEARFGKLSDPETQRKINEDVKKLKQSGRSIKNSR